MKSDRQHKMEIEWLDITNVMDTLKDLILCTDNRDINNELAKAFGIACGEYQLLQRRINDEFPNSIVNVPLEKYLNG